MGIVLNLANSVVGEESCLADTVDDQKCGQTSAARKEKESAVYVIGDLHGDEYCARYWVKKTGLIDDSSRRWVDPSRKLVFLGDYVDKGPTSKQTVEFVKSLTEDFPDNVVALMGNHEFELLLDRDARNRDSWNGLLFHQLSYASVHPQEYLNFLGPDEVDPIIDPQVVDALYNASIEVYGSYQHRDYAFASPGDYSGKHHRSILQLVRNDLREQVQERLTLYQQRYLDAFRTGTELGTWLEQRPVIAQSNDTIFVHGGISHVALSMLLARHGVQGTNQLLAVNAKEGKLYEFIRHTREGRAIYDLLVYRGNHQDSACSELYHLLRPIAGATRLAVGHTPGNKVRIQCTASKDGGNSYGIFLALDSSLSRWFRNSGNEYCPGDVRKVSSNGRYECQKKQDECEGQIIKIENGLVDIIDSSTS